ncbi:Agmatine iminohydrolase [Paramecium bursaria Chlorella virus 1]|uniref:Agmatine iminohydrolase n=1 Tax=Paramecium bursaria Chlorella virus 1 TaxID=10506 RepID=O41120_PBCV1|nr:Agmatine iminohydrolase [Paramecium bursaria Chlorella virus 1]AAC96965.2 Agmatine iminohydrolase [Paramecium bursaria Chlorella virus 1]
MTPKQTGFYMPGEFEQHKRTWMIFPFRNDNWRQEAVPAQKTITNLARKISEFEEVIMIVSRDHLNKAMDLLHDSGVKMVTADSDDCWARDTGATFITNGKNVKAISWDFNSWGGNFDGLYTTWKNDQKIAEYMARISNIPIIKTPGFVLEGGSIHVDGEGTLITTKECLLSTGRNPTMSQQDIEYYLKEYLNVEKIIWLEYGVADDETNGHVDNMACFSRPGEVILAWTDDPKHPQYERSKNAYKLLTKERDAKGRKLIIHKIHIPSDMFITEEEATGVVNSGLAVPRRAGDRLAASYVNFVMPNGAIIFPTFGDEKYDALAHKKFEEIFPEREIVGFYSREILLGGGNLHCITQQQPV